MERLSFVAQFKIKFLLPSTGCRKVLGKMFDNECVNFNSSDNITIDGCNFHFPLLRLMIGSLVLI